MDRRQARITSAGGVLLMLALPSAGAAATVTVDCNAGGKIQTALATVASGDTIRVLGVCLENVSVRDELARVTIDGQGTATVHGSSTAPVFQVLGRNITIKGFTVTGGRQGFGVLRGGSALIDSNTIEECAGGGILVHQNGHARIVNNTIQLNTNGGITVQEGSVARVGYLDGNGPLAGNLIRMNGAAGVTIQRGSTASLTGNTISENEGAGVVVSGASHGDLASNRIDANGADAVVVTQNSDVQLGDASGILDPLNDTTSPNGGFGLRCSLNSSAAGGLGTLSGVQGDRKFDSGCSVGPKIK